MDPLRSLNGTLRNLGLPPIELPKIKTDPGVGATTPGAPVDTGPSTPQPTPLPPIVTVQPPPLPQLPPPSTDPPVVALPPPPTAPGSAHPPAPPTLPPKITPPPSIPTIQTALPTPPAAPAPAATPARATALSKPPSKTSTSTSATLKNGHLAIAHKKGDAHLSVERKGSRILVKNGSQVVGAFPADKVKSLSVNGGSGDDHIKVNVGSKVKVAVDSGKGDDHVEVANGKNVSVFAGRGDNHVKLDHVDGAVVDDKSGDRDVTELAHSKHVHMRHRRKSDVVRGLTK